jgi:phage I-like protein
MKAEERQDLVTVNRVVLPVEAPARIKIIPWGLVHSSSGDFVLDRQAADAVLAAFAAGGMSLPIDSEHTTVGGEFAAPSGDAPARGWINSLEAVDGDGLYASVEWTEKGAEFVRNKEYRFLSPVTYIRKKDKRVVGLHSVALTNKPAIVDMPPIVNREPSHRDTARVGEGDGQDREIDMDATNKALGLTDGADEAARMKAIEELRAKAATPPAASVAVCKALNLPETAKEEEILVAVNKLGDAAKAEPDPKKYVPMDIHKPLVDRVSTLEAAAVANKAANFIAEAKAAGKICKSEVDHWLWAFKADPERAAADMEKREAGKYPADGKLVANADKGAAGDDRQAIIARASAEFDANRAGLAKITCKANFVSGELFDAGKERLTDEEAKKLAGN